MRVVVFWWWWYTGGMSKQTFYQTSVRMTPVGKDLSRRLSEHLGVNQSAVLELALRSLAERHGLTWGEHLPGEGEEQEEESPTPLGV